MKANSIRGRLAGLLGALLLGMAGGACACGPADTGSPCADSASGPASASAAPVSVAVANPVNVITGNKYQRETDMPALPGVLGLEIVRHYNSRLSGVGNAPGIIGRGWKLSYETQLYAFDTSLQIMQADGSRVIFSRDLLNPSLCAGADPAQGRVDIRGVRGREQYEWTWTNGRKLTFDTRGKLTRIQAPTGEAVTLLYDAVGLLVRVTDPQGRSLVLGYGAKSAAGYRGVHSIASPVGRFVYEYGVPAGGAAQAAGLANLGSVRYPEQGRILGGGAAARHYHYEDARRPAYLTGISVDDGTTRRRYATYGYDINGKAVLSSHAGDADKVTLDYSQPGVTTITNSLGQATSYRYTQIAGEYRLLEVRGAGCSQCGQSNVRYTYDARGRLLETARLDTAGQPVEGTRVASDYYGRPLRVSRIRYLAGRPQQSEWRMRYEYGSEFTAEATLVARPSVVPGKEAVTVLAYNRYGQPVSVEERGWAPDARGGNPTAIRRASSYGYKLVNGRSVMVWANGPLPDGPAGTPADSDVTLFDYDPSGSRVWRRTGPGNVVDVVSKWDDALRPAVVDHSDGVRMQRVVTDYFRTSQPYREARAAWLLDARKHVDPATRQDHVNVYRFDEFDRLSGSAGTIEGARSYRYDGGGNLTHVIAGDLSQQVASYDTEGDVTARAQYGPGGRGAVSAWRPPKPDEALASGPPDAIAQEPIAAALRVLRADGSEVRRWVDDFGNVVAVRSPERGLTLAAYSASGALVRLEEARGVTTLVERDMTDRPRSVSYHGAQGMPDERLEFRYHGAASEAELRYVGGRLASRIDWHPDAWGAAGGRQVTVYGGDGKAEASLAVRNLYDSARRVLYKTMPSGAVLAYQLDAAGRVGAISADGKPLVRDVLYRVAGDAIKVVAFSFGNGLAMRTFYDEHGVLASHASGTTRYDLHDTANGVQVERYAQRTTVDGAAQGSALAWLRSAVPQLLPSAYAANGAALTQRHVYDAAGRLTGEFDGMVQVLDVRYNALGDRLGLAGAAKDASGNVLEHGTRRLAYAASGALAEVRAADGVVLASYGYDAQGMRVVKRTANGRRYFLYEDGNLVAEADDAGHVIAEYVYLGRRPVARLEPDTGWPASWTGARKVTYLHTDQRNAVESVTDVDARIVWQARLGAFGELRAVSGARSDMPLRLSGQYDDEESGLYYNVHRYYDAATGRYLQPDPLGIAAGPNLYAYVASDPLRYADPLGLEIEPADGWVAPWLFGTAVHTEMARQVRLLGTDWGANDGKAGTWTPLRPDAYQSEKDPTAKDGIRGTLWELKPISWSKDQSTSKYSAGNAEVALYIAKARKGCWVAGSSTYLVKQLAPIEVVMGGKEWNVSFLSDKANDKSGLLFYDRTEAKKKPAPATVPAPAIAPADEKKLKDQMEQVKIQGAKEGWSSLQTIGMVVLVGLAIAALVAVAMLTAPLIAAVIASISAALAAAAAGTMTLAAALAAVFALGPSVASAAEAKGEEKKKGMLDSSIAWFKSWF